MAQRKDIESRLQELHQELVVGEKSLIELNTRSTEIKSQMLRINGAIQVLEELLENDQQAQGPCALAG